MTYRLAFDVSQQIPEIAVGITAAALLVGVTGVGLWTFGNLDKLWRPIAVASLAVGGTELFLGASRSFLLPIVIGVIGTSIEALRDQVEAFSELAAPRGSIAAVACAILLYLTASTGLNRFGAIDLANRLNGGESDTLEGQVTGFSQVLAKQECFSVEDRRFCYSDSPSQPGFTRTSAYGGPIQSGLNVRVWAIGDTIVRLEIATSTATPAATP